MLSFSPHHPPLPAWLAYPQLDPSIVVSHVMPLEAAPSAYKMLGHVRAHNIAFACISIAKLSNRAQNGVHVWGLLLASTSLY